jgi:hypothetical protein
LKVLSKSVPVHYVLLWWTPGALNGLSGIAVEYCAAVWRVAAHLLRVLRKRDGCMVVTVHALVLEFEAVGSVGPGSFNCFFGGVRQLAVLQAAKKKGGRNVISKQSVLFKTEAVQKNK